MITISWYNPFKQKVFRNFNNFFKMWRGAVKNEWWAPLIQPFACIPALTWEWALPGWGPQCVCLCLPVIHCSIWCTADTQKYIYISCNMSKFCSLFCTALGSRTIQCTDQESCCSQYTLITSFQFPAHKQCYQSLQHRSMGIKKMVNKTKCTVAAH